MALPMLLLAALCAVPAPAGAAEGDARVVKERWGAIFLGGARAGHSHTVLSEIPGERPLLRLDARMNLEMRRMGQTVAVSSLVRYEEDKETGEIRSFLKEMDASAFRMAFRGTVRDGRLLLQKPGAAQPDVQPWEEGLLGPAAGDRLVQEKGLAPGRTVTFRTYSLDFFRPVEITVAVEGREKVKVWGRERELWKATMTQDAMPGIRTNLWMDDEGDAVKTVTAAMGTQIMILRASEEVALSREEAPEVFLDMGIVALERPVPRPREVQRARFRLRFKDPLAMRAGMEGERQKVLERGENEVVLQVSSQPPPGPDAPPRPEPPPEEAEAFAKYLARSTYIQADAPEIRAAARQAAGDARTNWERARRMSRWVYDLIEDKDLGVAFASALETLETKRGDCTEHSVLLAALLRAEGIPARLAFGLVYFDDPETGRPLMGGHVWNEAWVGHWMALDATLPYERVDAMRLQFGTTALEGPGASAHFLALANILGATEIEILEVRHADAD